MIKVTAIYQQDPPPFRQWHLLMPIMLLALGFLLILETHVNYFRGVPGDLGDARFNGIILEYFYKWVSGGNESLLNPGFFYPMPGALAFSDNHWGTAWIYSIYRILGFDRYVAYDLWYLTGYLLNFASMHFVLRKLGYSVVAAAWGAFFFTFGMPTVAHHVGHAQLTYCFPAPLALLCWQRFRQLGAPLWLGWGALAVALQFYVSIYLGYFLSLLLLAWIAAQCWIERTSPLTWFAGFGAWVNSNRRDALFLFLLLGLVVASLLVLMYPYILYSKLYGFSRDSHDISSMLPRIPSYFISDISTIWHTFSDRVGKGLPMRHEHQMFVGLGALLLVVLALTLNRSPIVNVSIISLALLMLFTLNIKDQSFYLLFADFPGVNSIRAVSRIILILMIPLAILIASGIDAARLKSRRWIILAASLCVALMIETILMKGQFYDIAEAKIRAAKLDQKLPAHLNASTVIFVPVNTSEPSFMTELDGMLLAQERGLKTLNGYSGNFPNGYSTNDPTQPACLQAVSRMESARRFYAEHLGKNLDMGIFKYFVALDTPNCSEREWREIPNEQIKRIKLGIINVKKLCDGRYEVNVKVDNQSEYPLLVLPKEHPLRLSWQVHPKGTAPKTDAWVPRVDFPQGEDITAGAQRYIRFPINVDESGDVILSVSLVLEGRVWLHNQGFSIAQKKLNEKYK
ncbi:hypothetical protein XFUD_02570 [Xylella fastidiosa]|nr:hypothetical protein [Xylella fastidiosa]ALQ94222.1 hypothetical protein XFUD_02570 [Xylella fastidiosa]